MNPRFICFDLELNQPSRKIIQIGAVIGNVITGEVYEQLCFYVNPGESISPYITKLTGITDSDVSQGYTAQAAWDLIEQARVGYKANYGPITWGAGDLPTLKKEVQGIKAHRAYDLKSAYQLLQISQLKSPKAGLKKALENHGLKFQGTQHNALDDARNTFNLAVRVLHLIRPPQFCMTGTIDLAKFL